jgi:uncharacterized protein YeeX (DUF496 family)
MSKKTGGIVALNIFIKDMIVNENNVPILFYWDYSENLENEFAENEEFKKFIRERISHVEYQHAIIKGIYYNDNDTKETEDDDYTIIDAKLQNLVPINSIDYDLAILGEIFSVLWLSVFHECYIYNKDSITEDIKYIYQKLLDKYPTRVNTHVIKNYVLSQLTEHYSNLTIKNTEHIMNTYNSLNLK